MKKVKANNVISKKKVRQTYDWVNRKYVKFTDFHINLFRILRIDLQPFTVEKNNK